MGRRAHADGEAVIQLQRLLLRGHGLRGRREALRGNGHDLRVARISAQRTRSSSSLRSDGPYPRGSLSGSSGERQVLGQWPREEGLTTRSSTQHHERAGHRYRAASLAARGARPIRPSAPLVTFSIPQWPRVIQAMQRASCPMRRAALGHARPCPSERRGAAGGPWSAPTHSRRHVGCCPKEVTAIARVPVASGRVPGCSRDTRSPAVVLERGRNRPPFSFAPPHPGIVVAKRIDHRES